MGTCEFVDVCLFFKGEVAKNFPGTVRLTIERYCNNAFKNCARYRVGIAKGKGAVPSNMLPNQRDLAERIISEV